MLREAASALSGARTSRLPLLVTYGPWAALTRDQRRFAEEHEGFPGIRAGADRRMVFIYSERRSRTYRWLVDSHGRVVEFVILRYAQRRNPRRFVRVGVAREEARS
jgi:hypothetical protein